MGQTPSVLIVAENVSARFGGEAAIPLHIFRVLRARGIEAFLLTHERVRRELDALFASDAGRISYMPDTPAQRRLSALSGHLPDRVCAFSTGLAMSLISERTMRDMARDLVRQHGIAVVHKPIPVSPRSVSLLADLGAPVVMGPMNGNMAYPPGFRTREPRWIDRAVKAARGLSGAMHRLCPGKLKADVLLVANERTRRALPRGIRGRVEVIPENGVDLRIWSQRPAGAASDGCVRFVFLGRLVAWKGVDLLIQAFSQVRQRHRGCTLSIIGDGECRAELKARAAALGLEDAIEFAGWMSQPECSARLGASDVFVLPSLYECGGAVVLEAMAVIATNWGGPADYLDETCGILVDPSGPQAFVDGLAQAMLRLAASPELRRRMGEAGRRKVVERYDWERKVDRLLEIYEIAADGYHHGAAAQA